MLPGLLAQHSLPGLLAQQSTACLVLKHHPSQTCGACIYTIHRLQHMLTAQAPVQTSAVVDLLAHAVTLGAHQDVSAGFLFTLDIVLLFHTGFLITCNLRKRLVMDGYFVACYYVKHASLVIDVLATVPSWIEVTTSSLPHSCSIDRSFACSCLHSTLKQLDQ